VQDEGLAGAGPAGHLDRVLGLGCVLDGDELLDSSAVWDGCGRRGGAARLRVLAAALLWLTCGFLFAYALKHG
jgi:hypothetical protein